MGIRRGLRLDGGGSSGAPAGRRKVSSSVNKLVACAVLAVLSYGLVVWVGSVRVNDHTPAGRVPTSAIIKPPVVTAAPPHESGVDTGHSAPADTAAAAAVAERVIEPEVKTEPDYTLPIRAQDLPPELVGLMQAAYGEFGRGNIEYAAMLAQEALAISEDYPAVRPMLYGMIGYSYEKLGYIDMAMEQYRLGLDLYSLERNSYEGMRRLDPEFAATHPELPVTPPAKVEDKPESTQ